MSCELRDGEAPLVTHLLELNNINYNNKDGLYKRIGGIFEKNLGMCAGQSVHGFDGLNGFSPIG